VGKVMQPLQSVNCHDSRAHGHERYGPFIRLVGLWLVWFWLGVSWSRWFGYWYATGELWSVSGYRGKTYELVALGYRE
jgi:hypothetical protein